jgi:molybdopterin/thiamine biosynthesis adenylyltransferase
MTESFSSETLKGLLKSNYSSVGNRTSRLADQEISELANLLGSIDAGESEVPKPKKFPSSRLTASLNLRNVRAFKVFH